MQPFFLLCLVGLRQRLTQIVRQTNKMKTRMMLLKELVELKRPTEDVLNDLMSYGWDSDEDLLTITLDDIIKVLQIYLDGKIDENAIVGWASSLECREDLGHQSNFEDKIKDTIFMLSTPEINIPITDKFVQDLLNQLTQLAEPSA